MKMHGQFQNFTGIWLFGKKYDNVELWNSSTRTVCVKLLILSQTSPDFHVSAVQVFKNTVGKGDIAPNKQFLHFPQCFLTVWRTACVFCLQWL